MYKNRPLSDWLKDYEEMGNPTVDPFQQQQMAISAELAVKHLGTNAVPTLLIWAQAHDKVTERFLRSWVRGKTDDPSTQRRLAALGFNLLGNSAESAAPALIRLTKNPKSEVRKTALNCLLDIDPPRNVLLPALTNLLQDPDVGICDHAALKIIYDFPEDAERSGAFSLFPEKRSRDIGATNNMGERLQ